MRQFALMFLLFARFFQWYLVKNAVEFLFRERAAGHFGLVGLGPRGGGQFRGLENHMRGQEYEEFLLGVVLLMALEERADERDVAQDWNLGVHRGLVVLHQAADDHGFAVRRDDDRAGGANVDGRGVETRRDLNRLRRERGNLGRNNHFHQAVRKDERGDLEDDANGLVGGRDDGQAGVGGVSDAGDDRNGLP